MKKLIYLLPVFFAVLLLQSCGDDPIIAPLNPDIRFGSGAGIVSSDATLQPDSTFVIRVIGSKGDRELNGLTIRVDNAVVNPSEILVNGVQPASGTIALQGANRSNFTFDITFVSSGDAGTTDYSFTVTDAGTISDEVSLSVTVEKISATLAFDMSMGGFTMDGEVLANTLFKVHLIADAGSSKLNTLTVLRDDVAMMKANLFFNGTQFPNNPYVLMGDNRDGFTTELLVRAHISGVSEYAFEIVDTDGELQRLSFNLSAGTPVDSQKVVLLLNAGGGQGQGGVNLKTGASVNSTSAAAHLIDLGIDTNQPMALNWRKKIGPGMNATLRVLGENAPEGFTFSSTNTKEQIQGAYDTGTTITESEVVETGDLFLVLKAGEYFLLKINKINETSADNKDSYEIEVKL